MIEGPKGIACMLKDKIWRMKAQLEQRPEADFKGGKKESCKYAGFWKKFRVNIDQLRIEGGHLATDNTEQAEVRKY